MPSSFAVCCLLKILNLQFHLTQTGKAMDIFKLTAFDLVLAQPDLPNRFFSNPSGVSTQFFQGRVVSHLHLTDMYKSHCY
jgi:hypothetical protein